MVNCRDHDVSTLTGATYSAPPETSQTAIDHCIPGQTFQCMGGCGAPSTGYQVCAADGGSLGPCTCPPLRTLGPIPPNADSGDGVRRIVSREALVGGLPIASSSGSGSGLGSGGSGGLGVAASVVGAACRGDADCGEGLGCITTGGGQLAGSGPAGGYCSASCTSDAACQAIDPGSQCIGLAGQNVCARSCESRTPKPGTSKCLDRTDVMCVSVAARREEPPGDGPQPGLCVPACQSDAQCGPGLFCNLTSGLCSNAPPAGAPLGSSCDGPESCAGGVCLPLGDGFESVCSAFCRFGGPGCGFDASDAQPGAACVFTQVPGETVGDRGLCLELCQTSLDCHETGAVCLPTDEGSDLSTCVVPVTLPPDPNAPGTGVPIGKECSGDADCSGGVCLSSDTDPFGLGGGFPGGYCSAACTSRCAAGAVCVGTSDANRHCMKQCTPGPLGAGDCAERQEFTCNALQTGGFCRADCTLGGDCGDRVCDPRNGLCVEPPPGGGPAQPPIEPVIGRSCERSEDCGNGFTCLSADTDSFAGLGGMPGGYCSAECGEGTPCPDADDLCLPFPDGNFCLRGCDPSAENDCGSRADAICAVLDPDQPTAGSCVALCASDAECGARICDPDLGLCVDAPVPECAQDEDCASTQACQSGVCVAVPPPVLGCTANGDCPGGVCNPGTAACIAAPAIAAGGACTANTDCVAGLCLTLAGTRFCSGLCVWGTDQGCEAYGIDAFCLLPLSSDPNETRGVCTGLCNTAADCAQSGYECVETGATISGRTGTCLPPAPAAPAAPATPQSP